MEAIPSLRQINRSEPREHFGKLVKAQSYPMPDDHQFSWEFQFQVAYFYKFLLHILPKLYLWISSSRSKVEVRKVYLKKTVRQHDSQLSGEGCIGDCLGGWFLPPLSLGRRVLSGEEAKQRQEFLVKARGHSAPATCTLHTQRPPGATVCPAAASAGSSRQGLKTPHTQSPSVGLLKVLSSLLM